MDRDIIERFENRNLTKKEKIIISGRINNFFFKNTEEYLMDHFTLRRKIIDTYIYLDNFLVGRIENETAFMGKNKWLFYKGGNSIRNYQNIDNYNDDEIKMRGKIIENRTKYFKSLVTLLK